MKIKSTLYLVGCCLITSFIFSSCFVSYGENTTSSFTSLGTICNEDRADNIHLFFEGEELDFEYQKLGLVSAEGDRYADDTEVLDYLKFEAWQHSANTIIGISANFKEREEGLLGDVITETEPVYYESLVYTGIAVNAKKDSEFVEKYGNPIDTSFVSFVRWDINKSLKRTENELAFSAIGTVAGIILVIVAVMQEED